MLNKWALEFKDQFEDVYAREGDWEDFEPLIDTLLEMIMDLEEEVSELEEEISSLDQELLDATPDLT